jgi:hypothetical protein
LSITADRVQWFRAFADMERWQEEVEILTQESRRTVMGFQKMRDVWYSLSSPSLVGDTSAVGRGKTAYAKRQGAMYAALEAQARKSFSAVGVTWLAADVALADHIRAERPSCTLEWPDL